MKDQHDIDKAAHFADKFQKIVFEHYPDWKQYLVPPNPNWQATVDIAIEVPSRFAPLCPLRIETMWSCIIIYWVGSHIHCDVWDDMNINDENKSIDKSLEILSAILTERMVILATWKDGIIRAGGYTAIEELENGLEGLSSFYEGGTKIALSWNGTYDLGTFDPSWCSLW